MVLAKVLFIFVLFFFGHVWADNLDYLARSNKFNEIIDETEEKKDLKSLELRAWAYSEKGNSRQAIKIYRKILKVYFKKEHLFLSKRIKKRSKQKIPLNVSRKEKLIYLYEQLGDQYLEQFKMLSADDLVNKSKRTKSLYRTISFYGRVLNLIDEEASGEELQERLKVAYEQLKAQRFKSKWYVFSSLISWQSELDFSYDDGSSPSKLLSTNYANCSGFGRKWENINRALRLDICSVFGHSSIAKTSGSLQLQDSRVLLTGQLLNLSYSFKKDSYALGPSLSVMNISGNWEYPGNTELSPISYTRVGLLFNIEWFLNSLTFESTFGRIFKSESYFFGLKTGYTF